MTQSLPSDPDLLAGVLQVLDGPVVLVDPDGRILHANDGLRHALGWEPDSLRGQPVWESLVHPGSAAELEELFLAIRSGERTEPAELDMATADGGTRRVLWNHSVLRDPAGDPTFIIGTGTDVTRLQALEELTRVQNLEVARQEAREEALEISRRKFSGIIEIASEAIISIGPDQRIRMFNRGAEEIFGYEAEEILGEPLDRLIPQPSREAHRAHVERFGTSKVPARRMGERQEIAGLRKSGESFPAEASILKLDVGGDRLYTVVLRDISDRVRQQEAQRILARVGSKLQSSLNFEDTLRTVAEAMLESLADFCFVDVVQEDGSVRRIEALHQDPDRAPLAAQFLNQPLDRDLPHLVHSVLNDGRSFLVRQVTPGLLDRLAQNPKHREALEALDAESFLSVPLEARGRTIGALFCSRDRGRTAFDEADLELAEELGRRAGMAMDNARLYRDAQQAVEARDDVLSVVSHDLGNPLQAIFIGLESLERARPGRSEGRSGGEEYYLSAIRRSADTMQRLIQDLLEVRRMEAGHLALNRVRGPILPLIVEAAQVMDPLARVKKIELTVPDASRPIPQVEIDPARIQQVLSNLLGNAVKHTPEGGRVDVEVTTEPDHLDIRVIDTGPGIPEANRGKVFNRFWRAEDHQARGIGLGLAIARGLVEAHGGQIRVEAAPGGGSIFAFTLPRPTPVDDGPPGPESSPPE